MSQNSLDGIGSLVRQLISKFQPEVDCKKVSELNAHSSSIMINRQKKILNSHEQLQGNFMII